MANIMSDPAKAPDPVILPAEGSPPAPSKLTKEQKDKVLAWFAAKIKDADGGGCPLCGTKHWSIADDFVAPTNFAPDGGLLLGGQVYPHFLLLCSNCGNSQMVNAIFAGVLSPK